MKRINQNFFKKWTSEMSYVLGYIIADGCITISKDRKNRPFTFNITSKDKKHLYKIRKVLASNHKIGKKNSGKINVGYQLQIRNQTIPKDLMSLGVVPRKTYNLNSIKVSEKYFSDFVRGFFDGDGSVYIYKVNGTLQIKAEFVSVSFPFMDNLNQHLCKRLNISLKSIHKNTLEDRMTKYEIWFYIDDCEKLAEFMYRNNPVLYLPRKRQVFEKWKSISINRRHYIKQNYPSKIGWRLNQKAFV